MQKLKIPREAWNDLFDRVIAFAVQRNYLCCQVKMKEMMKFDANNDVVRLCAEGMELEGMGRRREALEAFQQAWVIAANDFEKFTSAHYVARQQDTIADKLRWDQTALEFALRVEGESVMSVLPSLYLNVAKCYEDLNDIQNAGLNYDIALSYSDLLPDDGYGRMITGGILSGIERVRSLR